MTLLQSSPYKKVLSLYSPLELVIADAPSVRNAFKFGFSDCKVEIRNQVVMDVFKVS